MISYIFAEKCYKKVLYYENVCLTSRLIYAICFVFAKQIQQLGY